jgi:hypothetical protein
VKPTINGGAALTLSLPSLLPQIRRCVRSLDVGRVGTLTYERFGRAEPGIEGGDSRRFDKGFSAIGAQRSTELCPTFCTLSSSRTWTQSRPGRYLAAVPNRRPSTARRGWTRVSAPIVAVRGKGEGDNEG